MGRKFVVFLRLTGFYVYCLIRPKVRKLHSSYYPQVLQFTALKVSLSDFPLRCCCTNEHSDVIHWKKFCWWKLFISYGENEHSMPMQNDLLQLFAIPAKWFVLANFCFKCKIYILKEVTIFLILIMVVFPNKISSEKSLGAL